MALNTLRTRFHNVSQIFSKDEQPDSQSHSSASGSLQAPDAPFSHTNSNTASTIATPPPRSRQTSTQYHNGGAVQEPVMSPMNGNVEKEKEKDARGLKKRFFSHGFAGKKAGGNGHESPIMMNAGRKVSGNARPMTSGGVEGLSRKEKLELLNMGNERAMDDGFFLHAIQSRFAQQFEEAKIEPRVASRNFASQREHYIWAEQSQQHKYPPHLAVIPRDARCSLLNIFDLSRLIETTVSMVADIPDGISSLLYGEQVGNTMGQIEARMIRLARQGGNIGSVPSIGNRADWFTDAVFAQQSFTGSNPTTIAGASLEWIKRFMTAANVQGNKGMYTLLSTTPNESMFVQDCSYFRSACNAEAEAVLCSDDGRRYGCASVTLMHLCLDGRLHPLAIVVDWRGSMDNSVCVFNQRLSPDETSHMEGKDWPWRYAKLCSQVSDWTRHELAAHLTDCHFVEEAIIVAAHRSFPADHVVFNLLAPHWARTLSLNAAARDVVVPQIITKMNGLSTSQTHSFILDAYRRFNFTARYVPTDLSRRGFPSTPSDLASNPQFHNYAWAKNISMLWAIIHKYVISILRTVYKCDDDVMHDKHVQNWCGEMHSPTGGQMNSFPDIRTLEQLANAVTMCIHIASPLHNSVNYLQGYYQSFVPNKPSCLASPVPTKLSELMAFGEKDFMKALPIKDTRVWRMCEQLPHLLSSPVEQEMNMRKYAKDVERETREKKGSRWETVGEAAIEFGEELMEAEILFRRNSDMLDDHLMPYKVLDPDHLAVSILM